MDNQKSSGRRHEQSSSSSSSSRRSLKRKPDEEFKEDRLKIVRDDSISLSPRGAQRDLVSEIRAQVEILESAFSHTEADRASAKRAIHVLSELAKNEEMVNVIVDCGAVPALVRHLQAPLPFREEDTGPRPYEHEVEKGSAFTLGLLAIKPEHQQLIVDAGALPHLVDLLKRQGDNHNSRAVNGVIRRAADAITNLAHENSSIKTRVRIEGGIPPLVELLEFLDAKVQRAAAGALRTLAFKNDENKNQIVDCNALPTLILMLRSEDAAIHYEAVGVIGNLVHSSPNIKKEVLTAGALQPVIGLLSSCCSESQREAALLLGQFAATDSDCKVHIVQRGAVRPLIEMLQSPDAQLREMSAFALGRLAQDAHNQAGIAHSGGVLPLLKLLGSKNGSLQHNAAFALYGLADNEDNVADLIRVGGVQKLQDGEFIVQPTRDCVAKTLKRLEEKIHGRVLSHLLYMMRIGEKVVQRRVALALAHLCSPDDQKTIFIDNNGLELLLEILQSTNLKYQKDSSLALCKVASKASSLSPMDAAPPSPNTPGFKKTLARSKVMVELEEQQSPSADQNGNDDFITEGASAVHGEPPQEENGPPEVHSDVEVLHEKVSKQVITEGHGQKPSKYSTCFLHYRAWTESTLHKFEDTWHEQQPLELVLGKEKKEMTGLAIGISSMKSGERALLHVGWELGYGKEGSFSFPNVPQMANIIYEVELIGFDETKEGKPRSDMTVEERIGTADRRKMDGNALFKEEKLEEAMQQYEMALAYMGDDFMFQLFGKYRDMALAVKNPCHLNMAACLIKLKRYDEAIAQCSIVLVEDENNVKALFRRGKARAELGQTDAAREDFLKARKYAPDDKAIVRELRLLSEHDKAVYQKQKELYKGLFGPKSDPNPRPKNWLILVWQWLLSIFYRLFKLKKPKAE